VRRVRRILRRNHLLVTILLIPLVSSFVPSFFASLLGFPLLAQSTPLSPWGLVLCWLWIKELAVGHTSVQIEMFLFERKFTILCQILLQKKNFFTCNRSQKENQQKLSPSEWCRAAPTSCIPSFYVAFFFLLMREVEDSSLCWNTLEFQFYDCQHRPPTMTLLVLFQFSRKSWVYEVRRPRASRCA